MLHLFVDMLERVGFLIADFANRAKATVKIIFNIPDYEKYVKHRQERHPCEPLLTEEQFYMQSLKDRY